uniref:Uncharacterized protein n=1 Tax=viral metagenome TaxID=1070528 RepID=A0A6M3LVJ0_9ZZZZ
MTIDEAIKILQRDRFDNLLSVSLHTDAAWTYYPDTTSTIASLLMRHFQIAIDLGVEALKREQVRRKPPGIAPFGLLPGETKD